MSTRAKKLTEREIKEAFAEGPGAQFPVILTPAELGELLRISTKTVYEWAAKGRLDGAFRKRGKHVLFWRDRAIDVIFNGKEWDHEQGIQSNPRGPKGNDLPPGGAVPNCGHAAVA